MLHFSMCGWSRLRQLQPRANAIDMKLGIAQATRKLTAKMVLE